MNENIEKLSATLYHAYAIADSISAIVSQALNLNGGDDRLTVSNMIYGVETLANSLREQIEYSQDCLCNISEAHKSASASLM